MVSRSKKLKIFLLTDLIILAVVIPGYFYVDAQILKPANFEITDLVLDSDLVQVGETITMLVSVTNTGDRNGNYTVTPAIDDIPISTKTIQLSAGETTTVTFTATQGTEGEHTITVGTVTKTFQVTSEAVTQQAKLQLTDMVTSRKEAQVGDTITVSVTATNIGDESGEFALELFVNDQIKETKSIQLDADESKSVQFELVENAEGEYTVRLGTLTTSFRITSEAQEIKPAEFQVTDLTVNPSSAIAGEAVEISVKVTNVGEESGTYTANLKIDGVTKDGKDVTLAGQATDVVKFEVTETNAGTYSAEVDGATGSFTVEAPVVASDKIDLLRVFVNPYEVWEGETVTITVKANNTANQEETLGVRLLVAGEAVATKQATLAAGESDGTVTFTVTAGPSNADTTKGYPVEIINLGNQSDKLKGYFTVAPNGFHTLSINRAGGGSKPMIFTLDGVTYESPYVKLLPVGEYSISTDKTVDVGTGIVEFDHWDDGVTSESRTLVLDKFLSVLAHYIVISGYASCPSLYYWNGTSYVYVTEVSNAGWLGYIGYIEDDGDIVFTGGNPWDHVKLDASQLQPKTENGEEYYDIVLFQQWDEIFYTDNVYMVVVDHPSDVDVYSTMINYVNRGFFGKIYTIDEDNLLTPISATNEKGEDILPQISELDGIFTPASNGVLSPSWDNITLNQLTLDLGDLSDAQEIKLVINGMVDWGPAQPYYDWIDQFKDAASEGLVPNGTEINPPAYMEIMDVEGNWIRVPQDRQMPIPGDYVPRTFAVNMTDLFPADVNEYKIRITNFWNVTFDYIGIDITPQENITVTEVFPIATLESIDYAATNTNASGYFTKYGNITELLLEADDKFVIGIQGDTISLKFPTADLPTVEGGMERSFFLFVASWFKDHIGNWGYEFDFTVEPLPFQDMSGFPYPSSEKHPDDSFMDEWNTRPINIP